MNATYFFKENKHLYGKLLSLIYLHDDIFLKRSKEFVTFALS